ncbi:hypothetical protein DFH07DRAFT_779996 [Mycena maculata]|uniref:Uncharacterized protein n=1 Tax=Mycena maculata TaxID=230809 RepID=A0AAD7MWP8_9AGAR|nr:hypothetical protein DFH07DRAFT_779996 [Mycena maculata]
MDISMMGWVYPLWAYPPNGHAHSGGYAHPVDVPTVVYDTRWPLSVQMGSMYGTFRCNMECMIGHQDWSECTDRCYVKGGRPGASKGRKTGPVQAQNRKNELGQKEWACPLSCDVTHGYTHGGHAHDRSSSYIRLPLQPQRRGRQDTQIVIIMILHICGHEMKKGGGEIILTHFKSYTAKYGYCRGAKIRLSPSNCGGSQFE